MNSLNRTFAVNARFLTRPASGVDRVAIELVMALAHRNDVHKLILLHPINGTLQLDWFNALPEFLRAKITLRPFGRLRGHAWEQIELPFAEPKTMLLSLCTTGPVCRRNHAVMIHDAQVWDAAKSYSWPFRAVYSVLLPLLARTARHVLTVSQFSAGRLTKLGIAPKSKPLVVLNGADHMSRIMPDASALMRFGLAPQGYLLAIGNLAPHKNLHRLVAAASARPINSPPLIIAGGINSRVFADAGLSDADGVRFIGRVSDGELRALYENAIALAFPSLTEGFGLPPIEAMISGCAVVATTGGAVPEICGPAALYADPSDTKVWTAALMKISSNNILRTDLIAKGQVQAVKYTWERAASMLMRHIT